ncbi:MAG TPA: hemerythrin domain-containing protein [Acidimicrobiales bacterium]|nr:hemerythrin domain-containing protein [Acidimicrobiales bacterium]
MDAITLLRNDHKTVKGLFVQFEKAGENAKKTKRDLVDKIIEELAVHAAIEEQIFYPAVREGLPDAEDTVLEGLEEHHIVKWTLSELDGLEPDHERFDAKVKVLIESVRHHMEEEEGEMFPEVRKALGRKRLSELGEQMEAARKIVPTPTRPHPRTPDTPPANVVGGAGAGLMDRARSRARRKVSASS